MSDTQPAPKPENLLVNLACNIALPTFVLMKLSSENRLGPMWGLVVALAFPVTYGVYDRIARKKTNFLSILGLVSVLLSGTMGLAKIGGLGFAIKDAVLPTVMGLAVLLTLRSKQPLVREIFFNESIVDVPRVESALAERGGREKFEGLLRRASVWLALTFIASAPVNFALARYILTSPPGTPEFNAELGKMHWVGPLVIAVPSMVAMMVVFWKLFAGLSELTGLTQDEIFKADKK
jgi:hypothetical protein